MIMLKVSSRVLPYVSSSSVSNLYYQATVVKRLRVSERYKLKFVVEATIGEMSGEGEREIRLL